METHKTARLECAWNAAKYDHPTHRTAVFLWIEVSDMDMTVPPEWLGCDYCAYVQPGTVGEVWATHPNSQKLYDSWKNEWDICAKLALDDALDDPWNVSEEYNIPEPLPMSNDANASSLAPTFEDDLHLFCGAKEEWDGVPFTH